jgi:hypothetical protein
VVKAPSVLATLGEARGKERPLNGSNPASPAIHPRRTDSGILTGVNTMRFFLATIALVAIALGAGLSPIQAKLGQANYTPIQLKQRVATNCTTTCYGPPSYRTCHTTCY